MMSEFNILHLTMHPHFSEAVEQNLGRKTWIRGYRTTT